MEEACDPLPGQPVGVKDWQQPHLDIDPVMFEDRRGKRLLAGKIRVERTFRDAGRVGDVFDAAGGESARMHQVEPGLEQAAAHLWVRRARHTRDSSRPVGYLRLSS